jgi:hypothetical protein
MTISSSLNAGVAGLNANANRLATISDNIANSATFGYKRAQTDFHSVVIHGNSNTSYSAGGVRTTNFRLIDDRGPLIATTNSTDLAIDGRGFPRRHRCQRCSVRLGRVSDLIGHNRVVPRRFRRCAAHGNRTGSDGMARQSRWQPEHLSARYDGIA